MIDFFAGIFLRAGVEAPGMGMGMVGWTQARRRSMHCCGLYRMYQGDGV